MAPPLLEVRQISKAFGGLRALHEVSFQVPAGEIWGLMGANGAGKTTLFAAIAGHLRPSQGDILFEGESLLGLRPDQICRRGVGRTFQIVKPFGGLSVEDNLIAAAMFGSAAKSESQARSEARAVLERLQLARVAAQPAGALTLAGQKRLELARAVATGARLLLIDEVMAGLTPTEVGEMLDTLRALNREFRLTLIVIEHVMQALMQLAHRIVVLHHGEKLAEGPPQAIAADVLVQRAYFGAPA
jgi:branched-chain amino acid transport system ATP-binding protein